ncbi:MAG TPA: glutathionylspermidine synthase family protein [Acidobacteriaceae bacterium]|nr:glutathionylspermidine synthase family protein [Acidobacteriaceae bacterium]
MRRVPLTPRADWQAKVEAVGLTFHSPDAMAEHSRTYWDESACYEFTAAEVDTLELAANQMQEMCLAAAQHVIDKKRYAELEIPSAAIQAIEWSWNAEPPAIYGRFDFLYNGSEPPKLLEYNADTPTSLLEAAVVQWHWLEEVAGDLPADDHFLSFTAPKPDQFNSIHDRLIAKWKDIAPYLSAPLYFAGTEEPEDVLTLAYLEDTARQAGLQTHRIAMLDLGWNPDRNSFVDLDEEAIQSIFKLYPWETMMAEQFGPHAIATCREMKWIEPIWKMLLSNKGILPILWELYPDHPNLLPSYFDRTSVALNMHDYIRKPMHSREGANITLVRNDSVITSTDGPYDGACIVQAIGPETTFAAADGTARYPVLGVWMVDQECGGMGIRESTGPITDNLSSFVPHYFR